MGELELSGAARRNNKNVTVSRGELDAVRRTLTLNFA
jgi:hypothetical protein